MGPKKRSRRDLHELGDLVVKHARIEESGETHHRQSRHLDVVSGDCEVCCGQTAVRARVSGRFPPLNSCNTERERECRVIQAEWRDWVCPPQAWECSICESKQRPVKLTNHRQNVWRCMWYKSVCALLHGRVFNVCTVCKQNELLD